VEKKTALQLQDPRTVRKVAMLDDHVCLAFAGELKSSRLLPPSRPPPLTLNPLFLASFSTISLCRSHRRRSNHHRQGTSGMPISSTDRRGSRLCRVHHSLHRRSQAGAIPIPFLSQATISSTLYTNSFLVPCSLQRYTQSGGVRPFGISCLIMGFDPNDETPRLYLTEPSGIYSAWKVSSW